MGIIEVKNVVTDFSVNNNNYGGDPTDNTTGIQTAMDEAEADGGGIVTLPKISDTQLGKLFFISKSDAHPYSVNVVPSSGNSLQGTTSITQAFETLMIVNAGANWYSIKIS